MHHWTEAFTHSPEIAATLHTYPGSESIMRGMAVVMLHNLGMRPHLAQVAGSLVDGNVDDLIQKIEARGLVCINPFRSVTKKPGSEGSGTWTHPFSNVAMVIDCQKGGDLSCFVYCTSVPGQWEETLFRNLVQDLQDSIGPKKPKGKIYAFVPTQGGGLTAKSLGVGASELIEDNYRPEVVKDYRYIVNQLQAPNPGGRIAILDGPPGSGKTYLVRALLSSAKNALFVMFPASLMHGAAQPDMLSALMSLRDLSKGLPIVLVIEDADACLVPRAADNISAISSLLNISDGIIGHLLDIRIVATTNAEIDNVDEAILRPGRLIRRVEVAKLDWEHANRVYERLVGKEGPFKRDYVSIAEIYAAAFGTASEINPTLTRPKAKGIGFSLDKPQAETIPWEQVKAERAAADDEGNPRAYKDKGNSEYSDSEFDKFYGEDDNDDDLIDEDPDDDWSSPPLSDDDD